MAPPSIAAAVASVTANDRMAVSGMLADGLSVESADSGGWRLLHLAARANAADVAQLLLVRVARGSLLGSFGPEALRRFAAAPQSRGANANAKSNGAWTALLCAAREGHVELCEQLLAAGAEVNATSSDGDTALHWAATGGHAAVAQAVLLRGGDARLANAVGSTPLHVASQHGHAAVVALLLCHGKQAVDARDRAGRTALMFSAQYGHIDVLTLLLQAGASRAAHSNNRVTAYELACEHGHPQAAKMVALDDVAVASPLAAMLRNPWALCRGAPRP